MMSTSRVEKFKEYRESIANENKNSILDKSLIETKTDCELKEDELKIVKKIKHKNLIDWAIFTGIIFITFLVLLIVGVKLF